MVAVLRPICVRADRYVKALRMKTRSCKNVVNVMAPMCMMEKVEGLVQFLTVFAALLLVIKTLEAGLAE